MGWLSGFSTRKTGMNVEIFGINVTKLEYILMCLKNLIVVVKCPKKRPHFGTINYHVYSELFHVHSGFSSSPPCRSWSRGCTLIFVIVDPGICNGTPIKKLSYFWLLSPLHFLFLGPSKYMGVLWVLIFRQLLFCFGDVLIGLLLMVEMVLTRILMPLNGSFLIEVKMHFLVGFYVYFVLLFEGVFWCVKTTSTMFSFLTFCYYWLGL